MLSTSLESTWTGGVGQPRRSRFIRRVAGEIVSNDTRGFSRQCRADTQTAHTGQLLQLRRDVRRFATTTSGYRVEFHFRAWTFI